jgi:hypothetical protein
MFGWLRRKTFAAAARMLTKPRGHYNHLLRNDLEALRKCLRPGDVILIDGDQRVSEVIKYLTQSTWSHAVLYVGDALLRQRPTDRDALTAAHGRDAHHLVVEALVDGVIASPLSKYAGFNLRVCRPKGLRREDAERVMREVIGQLGLQYDIKNLLDLARYFFPVSLIPRRFRRTALQLGSGLTTQVICTSMIGRAFQNVGFPIMPVLTPVPMPARAPQHRRLRDRLLRREPPPPYPGIFQHEPCSLITPRDFDLSPYFEVVKLELLEEPNFDYRRMQWADREARATVLGTRSRR